VHHAGVEVDLTSFPRKRKGADTGKTVDPVQTCSSVETMIHFAFVDVGLTSIPSEARRTGTLEPLLTGVGDTGGSVFARIVVANI